MNQWRLNIKGSIKRFFQSASVLYFIGRFLLFSLLLFVVWIYVGRYYLVSLAQVSKTLVGVMGYDAVLVINEEIYFLCRGAQIGLTDTELVNYNMVPFLALIAATPHLSRMRLAQSVLIGTLVIFVFHSINLIAHFPFYFDGSGFAEGVINAAGIVAMGLPFVLWLFFYPTYISQVFRPEQYHCPLCNEWKKGIIEHIQSVHCNLSMNEETKLKKFYGMHPELKDTKYSLQHTSNSVNSKN
jgi:hypothetical protein